MFFGSRIQTNGRIFSLSTPLCTKSIRPLSFNLPELTRKLVRSIGKPVCPIGKPVISTRKPVCPIVKPVMLTGKPVCQMGRPVIMFFFISDDLEVQKWFLKHRIIPEIDFRQKMCLNLI